MSTRAVYTFKGFGEEYHVYKHHDGYPSGAARWIGNAFGFAWELPRYEPDEFAAAFVAGNKTSPGGVRLMSSRTQARDVEYGYTVYPLTHKAQSAYKTGEMPQLDVGALMIEVVATDYWDGEAKEAVIWKGPLFAFLERAAEIEAEWDAA